MTLAGSASPRRGLGKDPEDGEEQETRPGGEAREQNGEGVGRKKGQRTRGVTGEMGQNENMKPTSCSYQDFSGRRCSARQNQTSEKQ